MLRLKRLNDAIGVFRDYRSFSTRLALLDAIDMMATGKTTKYEGRPLHRQECLYRAIYRQIPETLNKYRGLAFDNGLTPNDAPPIWICWLPGYGNMPELVKRCIRSIYDNAGNHPVKFIDASIVHNYTTMPQHVQEKKDAGIIPPASYADVLRMILLSEHGGLWVDADLFAAKTISEEFFSRPFTTERNDHGDIPRIETMRYPSKGAWTVQVLGGWKNNTILCFIRDAFLEYWMRNDVLIDYLFFDHLIEIARRELDGAAEAIKQGAVFNGHYRRLNQAMRQGLPASCYESCLSPETTFHTLNWKNDYPLLTDSGEDALFAAFLKNPAIDEETLRACR